MTLNRIARWSIFVWLELIVMVFLPFLSLPAEAAPLFNQINLVTNDQTANTAQITDSHLVNAWGISFSATSPFWISDNGSGLATLYNVDPATNATTKLGLEVTIPGDGSVTGQAFNIGGGGAFNGDPFLFVSEDGTISGWRGTLGTTAETLQIGSPDNVYKGTTAATVLGHTYLYAANFHTGQIDVLKGDAGAPDLAGKFTDPNLPSGYAPFNIQLLGDKLYVTYALQASGTDEQVGPGLGLVSVFDTQGNFLRRVGSNGTLNAPWGLAIAPSSFGSFAGDLLVGNFGDGRINVFDLSNDSFVGQLLGLNSIELTIDGLWGLTVGNGGNGGSSNNLYFSAGPDGEMNGLFGVIQNPEASTVPEPSTMLLLGSGLIGLAGYGRKKFFRK
ncbi:MAG: TIGR03118 family protein [Acidobacteriota bacterium]